jgi:hypothetical protein
MSLDRPRRAEEAGRESHYVAPISETSDRSLMAVGPQIGWHGNKSFIMKGRGSSVVEQPIRKPWQNSDNKQDS